MITAFVGMCGDDPVRPSAGGISYHIKFYFDIIVTLYYVKSRDYYPKNVVVV